MKPIKDSIRLKSIENRYNASIEDLLYQMHWEEDMMHKEIGKELGIPRVTITRWFKHLGIPTQSCRRFTDKNLTSWLYKIGKIKKKPRYEGPDRRIQRTKGGLNVDFFKRWSPETAYVLGYFAADGAMYINSGGSRYISFTSTDYELLEKVKRLLNSKHNITLRKKYNQDYKDAFLLQIGCKEMYEDLINLGFTPNKESRLKLPKIPKQYLRHFIRGYFDGDGGVLYGYFHRKDRNNKKAPYFLTCFAYANLEFLQELSKSLTRDVGMRPGYLDKKGNHLCYSKNDSIKLFHYMYDGVPKEQYLERKYNKFQEAFRVMRIMGQ
jgi:intein/homing endonuclease